jgi:hypothetical protein
MFTRHAALLAALCISVPLTAAAQDAPPKILQITYEQVKFGKNSAHERNESGWPMAYAAAKSPYYWLGAVPVTGGADVLYISGYQSYEEMQKSQEFAEKAGITAKIDALYAKDAEFVNSARGVTAVVRPDMSVGARADISAIRGWRITTFRVRIGQADEFTEARRMFKAAYDKAGLTATRTVWQVTNGVNTPTFMVFRPYVSLAEFDSDSATNAAVMAQYAPGDQEKIQKLNEGAILTAETNIYAIAPKQSYVPASFATIDFWKSNPVFVAAAAQRNVTLAGKAKP